METISQSGRVGDGPLILVSGGTATPWPQGYGRFYTPATGNRIQADRPWAIDNGAFSGFDSDAFLRLLDRIYVSALSGCLFVALPDVVGDWRATRQLAAEWLPVVRRFSVPVAIVGQDGVTVSDVPWGQIDAVFLGGTTAWKLSAAAADLAAYGLARGKWVHMGRVNTARRYRYAAEIGCRSVDGTFFSKWPDHALSVSQRWRRGLREQPRLVF